MENDVKSTVERCYVFLKLAVFVRFFVLSSDAYLLQNDIDGIAVQCYIVVIGGISVFSDFFYFEKLNTNISFGSFNCLIDEYNNLFYH